MRTLRYMKMMNRKLAGPPDERERQSGMRQIKLMRPPLKMRAEQKMRSVVIAVSDRKKLRKFADMKIRRLVGLLGERLVQQMKLTGLPKKNAWNDAEYVERREMLWLPELMS